MKLLKPLSLLFFGIMIIACSEQPKEANLNDKAEAPAPAPAKEQQRYSAESFFETTSFFGSNINAEGNKILVNSDESGIYNSYAMPVEGGTKTALTHSKADLNIGVSWFPKDDRIIYRADQAGNELDHVFVLELDGTSKDLTPGEELRARFVSWTTDGATFYITTNERNPKFFDLYRYKVSDYSRELIFQNDEGYSIDAISGNGRWLALGKVRNNADSNIFLADLESDETIPSLISEHKDSANFNALIFSRDNSSLVYSTDQKGEYSEAWTYTLNDKKHSLLAKDNWDVFYVNYSNDGRYQIVGINADASTKVIVTDTTTGKEVTLPTLPEGTLSQIRFAKDNSRMTFYINADNSPSNLFIYDMDGSAARQLTQALNPKMSADELVTSNVIRFKSFDDLLIPSLEYKPKGASATNKVPALLWIHGGPGGQSTKGYRAAIQHLVNHGYAILAVNNRGSSGYGKTFYHLDDKKHGEDDLQDIVYAKRYLETLDWVDHENIGIIGGSYGGYMTMAAMTFTNEFEVGINIFGVTNWERTLKNIPPWWESFKEYLYAEMGDPATDSERHHKISPLFHADQITKPVLVVQGANDPRVLQIESDEMVAAIKANNVPVEYVLFPDEGHGFRKKANRITASNAYVEFLKKHLK
ncbi:MAG: dipeptidyl aminopeptidase/acylaminoacyl peptidase [Enterobacterales bacterium]|jgi:dipeptidyl aminopeptidase/acylaminoacyl peptidase